MYLINDQQKYSPLPDVTMVICSNSLQMNATDSLGAEFSNVFVLIANIYLI